MRHWHFRELLAGGVRLTTAHVDSIPIAEYVIRAVLDRFQRADRWPAAALGAHVIGALDAGRPDHAILDVVADEPVLHEVPGPTPAADLRP